MTKIEEIDRRIGQVICAIEAHGYWVSMEPLPGRKALYLESLYEALAKIEATVAFQSKQYGTRGLSRRALVNLHSRLPYPVWGVELKGGRK